ncbi:MAG: methyltransferase domain-containing protein [Candidatus Woesearchaeota archaeon]
MIKIQKKLIEKSINPNYSMVESDIRFATNGIFAEYRAKRLKCDVVVDLCCGVGVQTIAFAKVCKKVIGIELDPKKVERARINAKIENLKNVDFIDGDVLNEDLIEKIRKFHPNIIFCDPERLSEEEFRSVETIKPDVNVLVSKYSKITDKIAIEFPPQIKQIKIYNTNYEKEYVSIYGKLKRLTLYFGSLKKCAVSAVSLPTGERLEKSDNNVSVSESGIQEYLYEIDGAVIKAGLLNELITKYKINKLNKNNKYLTSERLIQSAFLLSFKVLKITNNNKETIKELKKLGAGKVILKKHIDPKYYWKERNKYEKQLLGNNTIYLFEIYEKDIICEKIIQPKNK